MKKILAKLKNTKRSTIIRNSFLLPILSVVVMSISHVISWYDLGNPFSWAIYLSVAVEVFALASVSAASIKMKKTSIWLLFLLVTLIQIVGNVFFTFQDINVNGNQFKSWVDLVSPWFEGWEALDHKRFLAVVQGGTLPFMSLIALHFYIKFNENLGSSETEDEKPDSPITPKELTPDNQTLDQKNETTEETEDTQETEDIQETEVSSQEELEDEKKLESEQIHITDDSETSDNTTGSRRRLHPARY